MSLHDASIQSTLISTGGVLFCTLMTLIANRAKQNSKKLAEKLDLAQRDIATLLAIEEAHCAVHKLETGRSLKLTIRRQVEEKGHFFSGKFTPSRVKYRQHAIPLDAGAAVAGAH